MCHTHYPSTQWHPLHLWITPMWNWWAFLHRGKSEIGQLTMKQLQWTNFSVNYHKVSEALSPHWLTSCPDDHHLAAVRAVCSSSCLRPVTKSHINIHNRKLQGMPLMHCDCTYCHKHTPSEVSTVLGISVLAQCGQLTKGPSFKCPSNTLAVFSCMQFSVLYTSLCTTVISTIKGIPVPSTLKLTHFIFSNKVCKMQNKPQLCFWRCSRKKLHVHLKSGHPHKLLLQIDQMLFGADWELIYDMCK